MGISHTPRHPSSLRPSHTLWSFKLPRQKVGAGEHDIKLVYNSKMGVGQNDENQVKPSRGVIRILLVASVR